MIQASPINFLYVAGGGAIGAVARYLSITTLGHWLGTSFPYGTLAVNAIGSFVIGICAALVMKAHLSHEMWLFLAVGILGGFTTFSSFSLDVVTLAERGHMIPALGYVMTSMILCIGLAFAGMMLVRTVMA